jgi:predicted phage-related endonuclease
MNAESNLIANPERQSGIGGSAIAMILGKSPYGNMTTVYNQIVHGAPTAEMSKIMHWGLVLEPIGLRLYAEYTHTKLKDVGQFIRSDWRVGHVDARGVDVKTTDRNGFYANWEPGDPFTITGVPEHIQLQCLWYNHLYTKYLDTPLPHWDIMLLVDVAGIRYNLDPPPMDTFPNGDLGFKFNPRRHRDLMLLGIAHTFQQRYYRIPYDRNLCEEIESVAEFFWKNYILKKVPPPAHDTYLSSVKSLKPVQSLTEVTPETQQLIMEHWYVTTLLDQLTELKETQREAIKQAFRDLEGVGGQGWHIYYKPGKSIISTAQVLKAVLDKYQVPESALAQIKSDLAAANTETTRTLHVSFKSFNLNFLEKEKVKQKIQKLLGETTNE